MPLPPTVTALSAINILLERFTPSMVLEEALAKKFLDLSFVTSGSSSQGPRPDYEIVFNRLGVLATLKGVVAVPKSTKAKVSFQNAQIGELVLRANDFVTSKAFEQDDTSTLDLDLLAEFLPTWELMNPRNLAYGLARSFLMINHYLLGSDSTVIKLRRQIGVEPAAWRYDGVLLEDFLAIVFGLYSHIRGINPAHMLHGVAHCAIDSGNFLKSTKFPAQKLQTFLRKRSVRLNKLRQAITAGKRWTKTEAAKRIESDDFATDFLAFRQRPIIDLGNGKHLIVDIQFIGELLFTGIFFAIFDSLKPNKRELFSTLWGRIFELYLRDLFHNYYPQQSHILQTDINFNGGQIDALLDFADYVVIFEFKYFLLAHKIKHARQKEPVIKELRLKLVENQHGHPKAVRQLIHATQAVRSGKVTTSYQDKPIYPVVVVYEPSIKSVGVNTFLNEEFQKFRAAAGYDPSSKPLTTMSVQELEELLPQTNAGHVTWKEVLERRFDGTRVRITSLHQALYDVMKEKSLASSRTHTCHGLSTRFIRISRHGTGLRKARERPTGSPISRGGRDGCGDAQLSDQIGGKFPLRFPSISRLLV